MQKAVVILSLIVAGAIAASASATKPPGTQCSAADAAVGASYTVSAWGLPNGGPLNMVIVYPNGNMETTPITAPGGSYAFQETAEQAGQYTYAFVGKVSWPSGQTNKVYATCSMTAN